MESNHLFACFGLALILLSQISAKELVVKLNHGGDILGSVMKSQNGVKFYAFRGIPFAEPPTGERRFQPPVPKASWQNNPLDATNDGPICIQIDPMSIMGTTLSGQEDCLYLNVYTPQIPAASEGDVAKKAVLVWIHGGGFYFGQATSSYYGPGRIMDDPNIVLVSISYRLGAFGFLSTGDDASLGNYGMMDQALALQWVHDNIEAFGGDAERVTIFGESAGGASVGFHLLSPMSSGLFQNAVSISGSALCPWAFKDDPLFWAKELAESLNCSTKNSAELVKCLKETPAEDIVQKTLEITSEGLQTTVGFSPSVDGKFLLRSPRDLMTTGNVPNKVPLITGVNKDESITFYLGIKKNHPEADLQSREVLSGYMSRVVDSTRRSPEVGELFLKKYLQSVDLSNTEQARDVLLKMMTHSQFEMSHYETVALRTKHGLPTYAYRLEYDPSVGFNELLGSPLKGVAHADDLFLMFDGQLFGLLTPNENDKKIIDVILTMLKNFATVGNPTPNTSDLLPIPWKLSKVGEFPVYHIDNPISTSKYETSKEDLYQFWVNEIPKAVYSNQQHRKDEL